MIYNVIHAVWLCEPFYLTAEVFKLPHNSKIKKELKSFIILIVVLFAITAVVSVLVSVESVFYRYNHIYIDYIIADDYSYAIDAYNKDKTFSPIENLPSTNEEIHPLPVRGCLEKNKSKSATCYEYEYEGLTYLKAEIYDDKLITFGEDKSLVIRYYVENKTADSKASDN